MEQPTEFLRNIDLNIIIKSMGKNYRNRISAFIQIPPLSTLHEGHSKRKESIMSYNS